ncbi:MAG: helix-turn-helix domain-containing protein [Crocinitomicaceae bacterium]|nr:helix-turn-helix domain-containing protein [Crocinitomicaceae bacterium]
MATMIITPEDLEQFKVDLITEVKSLLIDIHSNLPEPKEEIVWIKSHQVQRALKISPGTLHTLRINGTLPYTKIGGTIFYNKADLDQLMLDNMRNLPIHG